MVVVVPVLTSPSDSIILSRKRFVARRLRSIASSLPQDAFPVPGSSFPARPDRPGSRPEDLPLVLLGRGSSKPERLLLNR
ncbi:unnamed protein product [Pseudo-nitzschia multistriata]|uniref:Uncharacterized protein n=1 Tax=Pseudo-nitzschia multistriata TaxID=183589 RepID=A0A448ZHI0_9STRA|nr:unnamed protein product [Pseudo-nitzschia multistriata]